MILVFVNQNSSYLKSNRYRMTDCKLLNLFKVMFEVRLSLFVYLFLNRLLCLNSSLCLINNHNILINKKWELINAFLSKFNKMVEIRVEIAL